MTDTLSRVHNPAYSPAVFFVEVFCTIYSMVQRKNKPSFFARASLLIKRLWQFVSVDIWHVTEYKLHIHILKLVDYFPAQRNALEYMLGFVDQYLDQMKGGVFVGIGLCFLLWTLISLLSNIEKAFNDIWQVQGGRSFYRKVTDYTSMFLILPILMVADFLCLCQPCSVLRFYSIL